MKTDTPLTLKEMREMLGKDYRIVIWKSATDGYGFSCYNRIKGITWITGTAFPRIYARAALSAVVWELKAKKDKK